MTEKLCGPVCVSSCRQADEQGERRDPARSADQRPVRVCMVDYLKSEAINREEVYLRRTF